MNPHRLCLAALAAVVMAVGATATAAKLYKWVDDEGRVHYSDTVPPEEAQQRRSREVKSDAGRTVEKIPPPPTAEELEARHETEKERRRQAEAEARRAEYDRMLLATYRNAGELKAARDERVTAIEAQIRLAESRVTRLEASLQRRRREAARLERSARGDPEPVYREIALIEGSIRRNRDFIERKRTEQDEVQERFARDLDRFRKLSSGRTE